MKEIFGSATILINNAGIVYGDSLLESKEEDLMKTIEVNTLSHCWVSTILMPSTHQPTPRNWAVSRVSHRLVCQVLKN